MDEDRQPQDPRAAGGRGRPDHHDPTAGLGGAPPALSALTLRLVLASIGLVVCTALAIALGRAGAPIPWWAGAAVLALVAAVDLVVVARRKARGEPG